MCTVKAMRAREVLWPGGAYCERLASLASDDPIRSPGFLRARYDAFGDPDRDPILVAESGDRLLGILALNQRRQGPAKLWRIAPSTTNGHSRYTALALDPEAPPVTIDRLLDAAATSASWYILALGDMPAEQAERVASWGARNRLKVEAGPELTSPVIEFGADRTAAVPARSKTTRRMERALAREGELTLHVVTGPDALADAYHEYLAAELHSWKAERGEPLTADPRITRFYSSLMDLSGQAACGYIHFLRLDGNPIAACISLVSGKALVTIKCFFDDRLRRFGAGTILDHQFIEWIANETDIERVDFYTPLEHYLPFGNRIEHYRSVTLSQQRPGRAQAVQALRAARRGYRLTIAAVREAGGRLALLPSRGS